MSVNENMLPAALECHKHAYLFIITSTTIIIVIDIIITDNTVITIVNSIVISSGLPL